MQNLINPFQDNEAVQRFANLVDDNIKFARNPGAKRLAIFIKEPSAEEVLMPLLTGQDQGNFQQLRQ